MAYTLDDASTQYLSNSSAVKALVPFTMSIWFQVDDMAAHPDWLMSLSDYDRGDTQAIYGVRFRGDLGGDPIAAQQSNVQAITGNGCTVNTWHHAFGVFSANDSRTCMLDGDIGNKGSNSVSRAASPATETYIGALGYNSTITVHSGILAEAAIWGVALTDAEGVMLSKGYSPLLIRPQSLLYYVRAIGRNSPEMDLVGGYDMTLNGGPTVADHPPIRYPVSPQLIHVLTEEALVVGPFPTFFRV